MTSALPSSLRVRLREYTMADEVGGDTYAYQARFRRHVEAGIGVGAFRLTDAAVATNTILSAINGVAAWYDPDGRLTADRIADHLVDLVLRMLEGSR